MYRRYNNIKKLVSDEGKNYYLNPVYPDIPESEEDIYVISTGGDRFDTLALQYFNDSSLWWIISIANPELPQNSYYPPVGTQLRIPTDIAGIIQQYRDLNNR